MFSNDSVGTDVAQKVLRVLAIVGGCKSALYKYLLLWRPDYCFGFDAPAELPDEHVVREQTNNVKLFKLGSAQTADTLFATAPPAKREIVKASAGIDAANGCAMVRGIGAEATVQLLQSDEWQKAKQELVDELLIGCKGSLPYVVLRIVGSLCGGTGGGGMQPVGHDLATSLAAALGTNVHLHFDAAGMVTFLSLGERIGKNATCALADLTDYATRKETESRITKSLSLVEYPSFRRAKAARDAHVLLDEQAIASTEVQRLLDQRAPNVAMDGPLGNISLRKVDAFTPLDPAKIAKAVADTYADQLKLLLDHAMPDPRCVEDIRLTERTMPLPREEVAEIACRTLTEEFEDVAAAVTQPGEAVEIDAVVSLSNSRLFPVAAAPSLWALPPVSPRDAQQRLITQGAVADAIRDRIAILEDERLDIEDELNERERKLKSLHGAIQRTRFMDRLRGLLTTLDAKLEAFEGGATEFRDTADKMHLIDSRLNALESALSCVEQEISHLRGHIQSIVGTLRSNAPAAVGDGVDPPVTVRQLSEIWQDLWTLPSASQEEQRRLIASCVAGVTISGLARITDAVPPRLEAIADRLARGQATTHGPFWGGQPRNDQALVINVIPPVDPSVAERLRSLILERNADILLAVADTATAGVNVVRFTIHPVRSVDELYPTLLRQKLIEAQQDRLKPLFLPFGDESLERLGLSDGKVRVGDTANE